MFGWVSPPADSTTEARIAEMAALSFNLTLPAWEDQGRREDNLQRLDWAQAHGIRVVIAPLSLPGARWSQNNGDVADGRLWQDKKYWQQASRFWAELAAELADHPAVAAYNILNEPTPERGTGLAEHGDPARYQAWYRQHQGTSRDLPSFYAQVIAAIRQVDRETPIMLDAGWYAQPAAFAYWPGRLDDDAV